MNKKILIILILTLTALVIVGCSSSEEVKGEGIEILSEKIAGGAIVDVWQTQSSDGTVMVDLTPEEYVDGKLFIEMGVNTHSVDDLDAYDLKEIVTLITNGKEYKPIKVPSLSGHHSSGELVFDLGEEPTAFVIMVDNLHDAGVREFRWP